VKVLDFEDTKRRNMNRKSCRMKLTTIQDAVPNETTTIPVLNKRDQGRKMSEENLDW
jgi:hypothetical protein